MASERKRIALRLVLRLSKIQSAVVAVYTEISDRPPRAYQLIGGLLRPMCDVPFYLLPKRTALFPLFDRSSPSQEECVTVSQ